MEIVLAITSSKSYAIDLIACNTYEDAVTLMKNAYNNLLIGNGYDSCNTFLDEDSGYAQIVSGLEQTEFRIGTVCHVLYAT